MIQLDELEIKNIEKRVFLTLKDYISREVKSELKKVLKYKKKNYDERHFFFL
ncbi:hypothetical protein LCGC14_0224500 [marine sediment metagenome]|uniref:Uncharacterized protein n=1 Tax=marine sediment metagenome TaxID=412755 RepID=A0A0F9WWW2_9ZZZZ